MKHARTMTPQTRSRTTPADAPVVAYRFPASIVPGVVLIVDLLSFVLTFLIVVQIRDLSQDAGAFPADVYDIGVIVVSVSVVYFILVSRAGLFTIAAIMRPLARADDIVIAVVTSALLLLSLKLALNPTDEVRLGAFAGIFLILAVTLLVMRTLLCETLRRLSARHVIGNSLVILGSRLQCERLIAGFRKTRPHFTSLIGVFLDDETDATDAGVDGVPRLGASADAIAFARARQVDDVVVAMPWNADRAVIETIERLKELPVNVYLGSDLAGYEIAFRPATGDLRQLPMLEVTQRPISGWSFALKAVTDYVCTAAILVVLAPLFVVIAVAIKLDTPGPVFFRQCRLGFNNQEFMIYKFRSMHHRPAAETAVVVQATRRDPRVTRVGRILRSTSLDELPQLFNVMNGTMSLVGPRPHAIPHNEEYGRQIRGYFARHKVKPGITGWAQVNGLRGETDTLDKMKARIEHDIYYAENWSMFFDIKILLMTAFVVLFQKAAY